MTSTVGPSDRALAIVSGLVLAVIVPITAQAHRVLFATWDHSAIRLLRSAALLDDGPFYPPPGSGWITASMYGPVSAAAYLPALWAPDTGTAVLLGQALSTLLYFGGAALVLMAATTHRSVGIAGLLAAFALVATLTLDLWALRYPALTVHADAPTLALGALCIAAYLRRRHPWAIPVSALCAVLAVWSKQVAIGVPIGLLVHALWANHWRPTHWPDGRRLIGWMALWSVVIGGGFLLAFGPIDVMLYHLVTVPGAQPWNWGGGVGALWRSFTLLVTDHLVLVGLGALLPWIGAASSTSARHASWSVPAVVALTSLPFALLGRAKVAGDVNAYSHSLFFLLLAIALGLVDAASANGTSGTEMDPRRRLARALLGVVPPVALLAMLTTEHDSVLTVPEHRVPYDAIERYVETRPDQVYLPRLGLVTWFVAGRLDHQAPGLSDYRAAGLTIEREHLLAGLPPAVDRMIFYDNPWVEQWRLLGALDPRALPSEPELPDCVVFEITR